MTRRTAAEELERAHTSREVHAALSRAPHLVNVRPGKHTVYIGPRGSVPVPNHNCDMPRGTLRSICRMAAAAGLFCLVLAIATLSELALSDLLDATIRLSPEAARRAVEKHVPQLFTKEIK